MKLSEKILSLRTARGLSQGDLAEKLDVSRQSVSKWETGQSVPDLDKIIKLADFFGVTTDYLLREDESGTEYGKEDPVTQPKRKTLWWSQVVGVMIAILGVILAGLAALGAVQGRIQHIELVFALLFVFPGVILALAPRNNLLAAGWTFLGGSALVFLGPKGTTTMLWLKKFWFLFVLHEEGSVQLGLWPWQMRMILWAHIAALCGMAVLTWKQVRKTK